MTQDKFIDFLIEKEKAQIEKRPKMMQEAVPYYDHKRSKYPDRIRMSFMDGSTITYDIHMDQPAPIIMENIDIIRRMKVGYQPKRRRNR